MALHAMIVLLAPLHGLHKGWVFGAVSGHSERVDGGETLSMQWNRYIVLNQVALLAGPGQCGGSVRLGGSFLWPLTVWMPIWMRKISQASWEIWGPCVLEKFCS